MRNGLQNIAPLNMTATTHCRLLRQLATMIPNAEAFMMETAIIQPYPSVLYLKSSNHPQAAPAFTKR